MDWAAFTAGATDARTRDQLAQPKTYAPADRGAFASFGTGAGNYFMRSLAETARNISMAGAVLPIIADKIVGADNMSGESMADAYFRAHDATFQGAVDYWTPKPGTVGKAGEITGQLAAGLLKFVVNPAWAVADAQMGTATDLTRAGVDTGAALVAGDLAGLSTVAGVALPFVGSTVVRKMASGVAGNLVPNVAQAAATQALLKAAGAPDQAAQFDPLDPTARGLDVLMGMAFGGAAHYLTRTGQRKFEFTDEQKNALLTVNQARHMERSAGEVPDVALTAHTQELRAAVDIILRGDSVATAGHEPPPTIRAETAEIQTELVRLAAEEAPKPPIERPDMQPGKPPAVAPDGPTGA
ncbi:MAG: hypothetical protein RJA36_52, partial [Pseudomonadota bacterium]